MRALLASVVIILSACTTYYRNPNPQANWNRDIYECQMAARTGRVNVYVATDASVQSAANASLQESADRIAANADSVYWTDRCLRARGWREVR